MKIEFPQEIKNIVGNMTYKKDDIGRSGDLVYIFENKYILKISKDIDSLKKEKLKNDWLNSHIPGPKSLCLISSNNYNFYLREYLSGFSLISKKILDNPFLLIDILFNVIQMLRKLDNEKCPFASDDNYGNDFVHGDLCLPNIYVDENNKFIGFIDVGNCGKGDKWFDYSWVLWSLQYNLKTSKYNNIFLNKLGIKMDQIKYNKYIPVESRKEIENYKYLE